MNILCNKYTERHRGAEWPCVTFCRPSGDHSWVSIRIRHAAYLWHCQSIPLLPSFALADLAPVVTNHEHLPFAAHTHPCSGPQACCCSTQSSPSSSSATPEPACATFPATCAFHMCLAAKAAPLQTLVCWSAEALLCWCQASIFHRHREHALWHRVDKVIPGLVPGTRFTATAESLKVPVWTEHTTPGATVRALSLSSTPSLTCLRARQPIPNLSFNRPPYEYMAPILMLALLHVHSLRVYTSCPWQCFRHGPANHLEGTLQLFKCSIE